MVSLVMAMISGNMKPCRFVFLGDHTQTGSRNTACRDAIQFGAEYLFFIDCDMDFPTDVLPRLKALDADIACPDMWSRNWPSFRTVIRCKQEGDMRRAYPLADELRGVQEIDGCGMACTLIKTSLLKRMQEPWFVSGTHGEDMSFCFVAKEKHGAKIICDLDMVAGHWGACRMAGQPFTRVPQNQTGTIIGADGRVIERT